tara:strand:- start:11757 stop:12113 length:357 start_codon:yes stop_codon:yes gene_type:complete
MSKRLYEEEKDNYTAEELFDIDFKLFSTYMSWNNEQERRNYKHQLSTYDDSKVIKKMFNTILDLVDTIDENERILKGRDIKIREGDMRIKMLGDILLRLDEKNGTNLTPKKEEEDYVF